MPFDVASERRIRAPRERVARYAMEPANDTDWIGGIKWARVLTEGPLRVGSRVERRAGFLGRTFEYVLEVTDLTPERQISMRSVEAPFPMTVAYHSSTTARARLSGSPSPAIRGVAIGSADG